MASISVSLDRNADRHDVKLLKRELDTLPGVTSVSVSSGGQLAVDYDATGVRQADILEKIQALGYHYRINIQVTKAIIAVENIFSPISYII